MSKEKGLSDNPGLCPVCMDRLTTRIWRRHMKDRHGWRYDDNDILRPQPEEKP